MVRRSAPGAQYALYNTLLNVLKLYAIFIPYITEAIYLKGFQPFVGEKSVHLLQWEKVEGLDEDILSFGEELKTALETMRRYKSTNNLSMKEPIESLEITAAASHKGWIEEERRDLAACTHAKNIYYHFI